MQIVLERLDLMINDMTDAKVALIGMGHDDLAQNADDMLSSLVAFRLLCIATVDGR